ncbi:transmembrane protein 135 [Anopheles darlingi]|uniref:Transmembrane protein 135 n=1 Tax=Anopheles darlingi TaxID=43151 RepID=W5JX31_ANODA|nr:transmembrane protein 135-like [Anopheles darlingi]XP_049539365.1 transmembrane protein 135-like [Anopheles darlingi]XP_049539366.1 transmembrane protein 135-like [Anopheles darlingi]ETN68000.1 transmembrane protein 135 [Anopheles darlingi]
MQVLSKMTSVPVTCIEYAHPWTTSCTVATAELMIVGVQYCLRIYAAVYALSLVMRGRIPTLAELKKTIRGWLQSTAFLTTNAYSYMMITCLVRRMLGSFNFYTVSYLPAFFAAFVSIMVERSSRRGLLALYVSNVATETLWNILQSRGVVRSIPHGEIAIFGLSTSVLMYCYRRNRQKDYRDSMFDVVRFAIGDSEVMKGDVGTQQAAVTDAESTRTERSTTAPATRKPGSSYPFIQAVLRAYLQLTGRLKALGKHKLCRHRHSCLYDTLSSGVRMFSMGLGIQVVMKLVLQLRKFIARPALIRKTFLNKEIARLGLFLGGFTSIYKMSSCLLRHFTDSDSPLFAFPSGLLASLAFGFYADNTIALYIMWKTLQITYNWGIDQGYLPKVPGFTVLLYSASTALLFHAATIEPKNLRPSYWKFLHSISGGRICIMDRSGFDAYGLDTTGQIRTMMNLCKTEPILQGRLS